MPDYYSDLNLDPSASPEEIQKAGRAAMRKHHPDTGDGDREKFDAANRAWAVLRDPERKAKYDRGEEESPQADSRTEVFMRMSMLLNMVMNEVGDNYSSIDLLSRMNEKLKSIINATLTARKANGKQIIRIKKVLKRFKYSGKESDIFRHHLEAEIRDLYHGIEAARREAELCNQIRARLADYEYEFEAPPPKPSQFWDAGLYPIPQNKRSSYFPFTTT